MSKSKADIIMENAVRHGLVTYRNITMETVEPEDFTGLPTMNTGVDKAVTGGDTTVYGRPVYGPEINQALQPEQTMKLYQWHSKVLQAYGDGDIIVMAETVDEARGKVFKQFDPLKDGNPFEDCYLQMLDSDDNEEYMHEYIKKLNALREDLNKEPMQPISDVICIRGSD